MGVNIFLYKTLHNTERGLLFLFGGILPVLLIETLALYKEIVVQLSNAGQFDEGIARTVS